MKGRSGIILGLCVLLVACDETATGRTAPDAIVSGGDGAGAPATGGGIATAAATPEAEVPAAQIRDFERVRRRIAPATARVCAQQGGARSCTFRFRLDPRSDIAAGALVTQTKDGAALIVATGALLQETRNADELAFVLSHMAGHHIEGHKRGGDELAIAQALLSGAQGAISGNVRSLVNSAIRINSASEALKFSRGEEIAADALATRIVSLAGYDPLKGVAFFDRAPAPARAFLGIHRPDAGRVDAVRRVSGALD